MNYFRAYVLFCAAFCGLLCLLLRRKAYQSHPAFFTYIAYVAIWQTSQFVVDCLHPIPAPTWLGLYRIEAVVEQVLSAWVCVSLLWEAFFPVICLSKRTMTLWLAAIPTLAVAAVLLPQVHPILTLDRVVYFAMTGCFAIVTLQLGSPRVYIKSHSYGVGLGFLLLLVAGAVRSALVSRLDQGDTLCLLTSVAVCGLWGVFFACKDLPCRPMFHRTPDPDGSRAKCHLESLGRPGVYVIKIGNEALTQWNAPGAETTFCVRAEQLPTKSAVLAHESVKLAEFERHQPKSVPQSKQAVA